MKRWVFLLAAVGSLLMCVPASAYPSRWVPVRYRSDSIGRCDDYRNSPDVQIANCEKALRAFHFYDKGTTYLLDDLGSALWARFDYPDAIATYTKAIEVADKSEVAYQYALRGSAYLDWGKQDLAEKDFQIGVTNYDDAYSYAGFGYIAMRAGKYADAIKNYDEAITLRPEDLWLRNDRAEVYVVMGDYDKAMQDDAFVMENFKTMAFPYNSRCWHRAVAIRDLDEALADCNRSLDLQPDDPSALDSRGFVRFRQGRWAEAIADYTTALSHDAYFASSIYMRGISELRAGQTDKGNADIAHAKSLYPDISAQYATYGVIP